MRIFILTMEDPVYTLPFIKEVIKARQQDIVGIATSKGNRLTLRKKKSKITYIASLLLIMGIPFFLRNSGITLFYRLKKYLSLFTWIQDPSIRSFAHNLGIPSMHVNTPNSKVFLDYLRELNVDLIINQSQCILKPELLQIPSIGTINRHNALLPKNRGRLTPFWVLYRKEKESGVSIHFVEEQLDSGTIILQERFDIARNDTFRSVVNKNYQIAPRLMVQAIKILESGKTDFLSNDNQAATYNSTPTFREAWAYRKMRLFR